MSPPLPKSPAFISSNARLGGASPDQNRVSRRLSTLVKNVPSVVTVKTSHLEIVQRTFPVFRSHEKTRSRSAPQLNPLARISDAYAVNERTSTQAIRNVGVVLRELRGTEGSRRAPPLAAAIAQTALSTVRYRKSLRHATPATGLLRPPLAVVHLPTYRKRCLLFQSTSS